jgi:hypothetical protein
MNSWYHISSAAMAGGGVVGVSPESDHRNPAAIHGQNRTIHISLLQYPADIQAKSLILVYPQGSNTIALSLRHLGYGDFEEYDEDGNRLGDYVSGDTWISGSVAHSYLENSFLAGVTSGFFISQLADYQSVALTITIGAIYSIETIQTRLGLSLQNSGIILSRYTDKKEKLPTTLTVSMGKRLAYLPLDIAVDFGYRIADNNSYLGISGVFDLPYQFKLRWGMNTNKLYQETDTNYINDFLGSSGFGLAYDNTEYRFEFGGYFFTTGGWIVGMGLGIYF